MTILEVLTANVNKLGNLHIPAKEIDLVTGINEVMHDLQVCCEALAQANTKQDQDDEEASEDETDTQ